MALSDKPIWVIKIQSSALTKDGFGLDHKALAHSVDELAELHNADMNIIVVSSGAVAEGMHRLGWSRWPGDISSVQAAAAVGQAGLMEAYETNFRRKGIRSAQILLTKEDFSTHQRYCNVQASLRKLAQMRTIAVISENDTIATQEIGFGENDTLAALVANMTAADRLLILTDQPGLHPHT